MNTQKQISKKEIWEILRRVKDPEIPVLTIEELGILREVEWKEGIWQIHITPTYVGCPAMDMITRYIQLTLDEHDIKNYNIHTLLSPAWTTDWIQPDALVKLKKFGIAPPMEQSHNKRDLLGRSQNVPCPRCDSTDTELISHFGSTACKAQYQCKACQEPFEYFKCH